MPAVDKCSRWLKKQHRQAGSYAPELSSFANGDEVEVLCGYEWLRTIICQKMWTEQELWLHVNTLHRKILHHWASLHRLHMLTSTESCTTTVHGACCQQASQSSQLRSSQEKLQATEMGSLLKAQACHEAYKDAWEGSLEVRSRLWEGIHIENSRSRVEGVFSLPCSLRCDRNAFLQVPSHEIHCL